MAPSGMKSSPHERDLPPPSPPVASLTRAPSTTACHGVANDATPVVHLTITRRAMRRIWWLILVVQMLNGLYLLFFSYLYASSYAWAADSLVPFLASRFLMTPQQAFLRTYSVAIGSVYGLLAVLFAWHTLAMVVGTVWNRQPSFAFPWSWRRTANGQRGPQLVKPPSSRSLLARSLSSAGLLTLQKRASRAWIACGVRGQYFNEAILIRETVELVYQAVQANQVSHRISNRIINHAYTALIALNAALQPVVSRVYAQNPPMRRFAVVFTDLFLDFTWGCVLPVWMLWPYLHLDRSHTVEQLFLANGLGSIENAQREVEQLVVLSWSALLLSVLPFAGALMSLRSVKKLLARATQIGSWAEVTAEERVASLVIRQPLTGGTRSAGPRDLALRKLSDTVRGRIVSVGQTSRLVSLGHVLLSLGGIVVTLISVGSSGILFLATPDDALHVWPSACRFPLLPWLATKSACAAWVLDCRQMGIRGDASELHAAFALVHTDSLVFLGLASCPQLAMDGSVVQFRNLRALTVWDSHLAQWDTDVALSQQNFPVLQTVVLSNITLNTEYHELRGFTHGTWGESVENVVFVDTDITRFHIPDTAMLWRRLRRWHCAQCGLLSFPLFLFQSSELRMLILRGTAIDAIPPLPPHLGIPAMWPQLEIVLLQGVRALQSLPDDLWALLVTGSLHELRIEGTNLSVIPRHWIPRLPRTPAIFATGSPLCDNQNTSAVSAIPALVCDAGR